MIHIYSGAMAVTFAYTQTNNKQISKSSEKNVGRDENLPFSSEFDFYRKREEEGCTSEGQDNARLTVHFFLLTWHSTDFLFDQSLLMSKYGKGWKETALHSNEERRIHLVSWGKVE